MKSELGQRQSVIRLEQVSYRVGGKAIFDQVDLEIRRGEIFSVIGRSGTGKTTMLRLMMGLIRPNSGRIWVGDREITNLPERELNQIRVSMAFVFQGAALFDSLSVFENVAFGLRQHRRLTEAQLGNIVLGKLRLVGLEGTERMMPAELSGGMQKRVGIARALALDPQVILYDEPTAGLDPIMAHAIDDLILQLQQHLQVTSVVASHELGSLMRISDRLALLDASEVVACGTPDQMMQSDHPLMQEFIHAASETALKEVGACRRPS